jgi:PAS domain S-box-containing protein
VWAFFKKSPEGEATVPWGMWYAVGSYIIALLWGAFGVAVFPTLSQVHQTLLCFFFTSIALGSTTVFFPRKEVYTPFVLVMGLLIAGTLIHQGSTENITMGVAALLFIAVLLATGGRMHSTLTDSLRLGFENQALVESLQQEKAATELLNESLRKEICERKKAEAELRKLASVVRYTGDLVNLTTLEGKTVFLNDAGSRMLGIEPSEVESHVITEAIPDNLLPMVNNEVLPELQAGGAWEGELQYRNLKTGDLTDVQAMCFVIKDPDTDVPLFLANVSRDITERKRAEEALLKANDELEIRVNERTAELETKAKHLANEISVRERAEDDLSKEKRFIEGALDTLTDAFVVFDLGGKFLRWNKAVNEITGYSDTEISNLSPLDFFAREDFQRAADAIATVAEEGHATLDSSVVTKAQEIIPFEFSSDLIRDERGMPVYMCAVGRDATERKQLEDQLRQAQKMEAVGTLAGGIAHDFNNLLQIILGYSDLLMVNKMEDRNREKLRIIRRAAQDGSELVRGLLTFSRMVKTSPRPLDLNQIVTQISDMLCRTIPKMIHIKLMLADDLKTVYVDPGQMEQVLLNLAVNARDAMPDGGRLTIETENTKLNDRKAGARLELDPGEYVLLKVSDTGHGMDKAIIEHIFEPFYTTKKTGEGTGLGLAMVFGIVKSHKGEIVCCSEPGNGTTFRVYLPAVDSEIEQEEATPAAVSYPGTETILLVDDEELVKDLAKEILESAGYRALVAGSGPEALDIYKKQGPDISLVILDMIMPEIGGQRCLDELLNINPEAKVLVASGYSVEELIQESIEAGAKGFLGKPYDSEQILQKVRKILDGE